MVDRWGKLINQVTRWEELENRQELLAKTQAACNTAQNKT